MYYYAKKLWEIVNAVKEVHIWIKKDSCNCDILHLFPMTGKVIPYMGYIDMCSPEGLIPNGFLAIARFGQKWGIN